MNRYLALDAMRGLTIAAMILVNTPGDWSHVYAPLLHSHWHGLTATDLVFPFFLFIIGSAMFFAFKKVNYQANAHTINAILKRSSIIFVLGLFLNAFPFNEPIESLRIMGVLQRIALCYLLAAFIILKLKQHQINIFIALLLIIYWAILATNGYQITGNLVQQVDLAVLGKNHMYVLQGYHFDPEGLLSSLPGVASMLIGFQVTKLLTQSTNPTQGIKKLLITGVILLVLGTLWSVLLPINKSLWTSSYVLISSAFACFVLAIFVLFADVYQQKKLIYPLLVYGLNPLFIYVVAWLWDECYRLIQLTLPSGEIVTLNRYLYLQLTQWFEPLNASLLYAILHVGLFWLISLILYKKNIMIKI